jgi:hypothetical protein
MGHRKNWMAGKLLQTDKLFIRRPRPLEPSIIHRPQHFCYTSRMQVHIGTSGWQYDHWRGPFYPATLKKADWLSFYAGHLDALEINASFSRDLRSSTYEK